MADVKWIKIATDIFENRKIRQIENLPDGDAIIVIWVKLLCLAGNINDSGMVYLTKEIPYTDQMLSTQFNRPLTTIQLALKTFEQFGMIEIIDDILHISNWERYQNIEGMEKIREQNRIRKQRQREKEKRLSLNGNVMSRDCHAIEENRERRRRERDKDKSVCIEEKENAHTPKSISYESLCKKYGKEFVDERIERSKQYNNTDNLKTVAKWCEEDSKRIKASNGSRRKEIVPAWMETKQEYDFDALEKELASKPDSKNESNNDSEPVPDPDVMKRAEELKNRILEGNKHHG